MMEHHGPWHLVVEGMLPPSVNHQYVQRRNGRKALTTHTRSFRSRLEAERLLAGFRPLPDRDYAVHIVVTMPNRRVRDLDNMLKSVLDATFGGGNADRGVARILLERVIHSGMCRTEVWIEEMGRKAEEEDTMVQPSRERAGAPRTRSMAAQEEEEERFPLLRFVAVQLARRATFVAGQWPGSLEDLAAVLATDRETAARVGLVRAPRAGGNPARWAARVAARFGLDPARVQEVAARLGREFPSRESVTKRAARTTLE